MNTEHAEHYVDNLTALCQGIVSGAVVDLMVDNLPVELTVRISAKHKAGGRTDINRLFYVLSKVREIELDRSGNSCCFFATLKINEMISNREVNNEDKKKSN